jgi:hydroxymethylbilane synthase
MLGVLGGGCQVPVGAYATVSGDRLHLRAVVSAPDGKTLVRRECDGSTAAAEATGAALGRELLDAGAREILAVVYGHAG